MSTTAERSVSHGEKITPSKEQREPLGPSADMAWFLGTLCGGVAQAKRPPDRMRIHTVDTELAHEFGIVGSRLLGISPEEPKILGTNPQGQQRLEVGFTDKDATSWFGDLTQTEWYKTVAEKHGWIQSDDQYLWKFLEGLFETRANIRPDERQTIYYYSQVPDAAVLIQSLLKKAGVKVPQLNHHQVSIDNFTDKKYFASHIHSVVPDKEAALDAIRLREVQVHVGITPKDALHELDRFITDNEYIPGSDKLAKLRKGGQTKYARSVYETRFGMPYSKVVQIVEQMRIEEAEGGSTRRGATRFEPKVLGLVSEQDPDRRDKYYPSFVRQHYNVQPNKASLIDMYENRWQDQEEAKRRKRKGEESQELNERHDEEYSEYRTEDVMAFLQKVPGLTATQRDKLIADCLTGDNQKQAMDRAKSVVEIDLLQRVLAMGVSPLAVIQVKISPYSPGTTMYYPIPVATIRWASPVSEREQFGKLPLDERRKHLGEWEFIIDDQDKNK